MRLALARCSRPCLVLAVLVMVAAPAHAQVTTLFSDDFERPDGPLDGWTVTHGSGNLIDGSLQIGPTGEEYWLWAGDPALEVPPNARNVSYSFDMEFLSPGSNLTVGRHAGLAFCCDMATQRSNPNGFSGYFVDWIDRTTDFGFRLTRVDAGGFVEVVPGTPGSPLDPPLEWRVEVDDTNIRVFGDDVLYIDFADDTYRGGFFGFWSWTGDQQVVWDNLEVTGEIEDPSACFTFTPANPLEGNDVFFDARCSTTTGTIVAWDWQFGDGQSDSGETVEHIYNFADNYTVTLTIEDADGNTDSVSRVVPVGADVCGLTDDFERAAGPVDGWTSFQGDWNITGSGELQTITGGQEHWLWLGDPPGTCSGDFVAEFDMEFLVTPVDGVGRHAGFMFHAADPTIRWQTSGYFVDWIDRTTDRGLRFTRSDGGTLAELVTGAPGSPAEPPLRWRVEVEGPSIRVFGDGVLYIDLVDETYRSGHMGFWAYLNGQDVIFDNFGGSEETIACFTRDVRFPGAGDAIAFNAACSSSPEGTPITSYDWDFGDGNTDSGETVTHAYAFADTYTVTLTVTAGASMAEFSSEVTVHEDVLQFSDDFDRADGEVDGWTVFAGDTWAIAGNELVAGPTSEEYWIWAGSPPVRTAADASFEFEYSFLSPGTNIDVGRHGGFQFHASAPTRRTGAGAFSGYFVDWIDRITDFGVRLSRVDNGALVLLGFASVPKGGGGGGGVPLLDPPLVWRVESDGDHIRVFGDGDLFLDVVDGTHRSGFFGFWTWIADQEVAIDNLTVDGTALTPCFTTAPAPAVAGSPLTFDGSCSEVFGGGGSIVSWDWDFGDGNSTAGESVDHTYAFPDSYTVTLTVEDDGGNMRTLERVVTVAPGLPFSDDFERAAGPVDGWTAFQGDWNINDSGQLSIMTAGAGQAAEAWLWAGDPAVVMSGDVTLEWEAEYLFDPMDGVGRHGGVMIYGSEPTIRWQINGYTVWWIDRLTDFGIVVMRWDNGVLTALNPGTADAVAQPPLAWRVEVEGAFIRVFGDGQLLVEVEDDTYRAGHLGLWAYTNNQDILFDNVCISNGLQEDPCIDTPPTEQFVRGDSDQNQNINLTDGVHILRFLFVAGAAVPGCLDASDADDMNPNNPNLTDGVFVFLYLFAMGSTPPPPSPSMAAGFTGADCGPDPTPDDGIGCAEPPSYCN